MIDTHLALGAFVCGCLEWLAWARIVRRHGLGLNDFEQFMAQASLEEYVRVRAHIFSGLMMFNLAGILRWLP